MKIEVEITKIRFFAIFGALLFIAGLIGVTAYNAGGTGGNPSNAGHSVDEIDWSKTILSSLVVNGNISVKNITSTSLASTGAVTGTSVCINGDCKSAWPSSSTQTIATDFNDCTYSTGQWAISGTSFQCASGYAVVGGRTPSPNDNREPHLMRCCRLVIQ